MKYKYNISNLDCANCAKKIEDALNKDKNIKSAIVNFSSLKLTIETDMSENVLKYVSNKIKEISLDVKIYEKEIKEEPITKKVIILLIGIILGLLGTFLPFSNIVNKILIILSYIILLYKTAIKAIKMLIKEKSLNENFLITLSCIGAYAIGKQSEGLMVIILYEIGKILESMALNKSRKSISELMNIKPSFANKKVNNEIITVKPEEVNIGDIIVIKSGEKIPLDGEIIAGSAKINTSAITGESLLKEKTVKDEIISGMINEDGIIEVRVTKDYENSTVSKILELVENATDNKAKTETFVSQMAKIYTPCVFILSVLVVILGLLFTDEPFITLIYKALIFLVISCPCAIAISVPLSYFAGIGKCSKKGILVKGSNYLDNLRNINKIVFDKTGTITTGKFDDIDINILDKHYNKEEIEKIIYKGESLSNHPIAKSFVNLINIKNINNDVKKFKEYKGKGISFEINNDLILIGNYKLCNMDNKDLIYVSINGKIVAEISIVDKIKDNAKEAIQFLKERNIICEMFTGDGASRAMSVASKVGIEEVKYSLLPIDKYNLINKYIKENKYNIAFVGDGINDSPTLALAHIGISMGLIGMESAIQASDIVIMTDDLKLINEGIKISKYTNKIIKENLLFALTVKVVVLLLSVFGIASMWQAVFADVGVTLITIINSTRILNKK